MTEFETVNDNGVLKQIPKRTEENTNVIPRDLKSFNITRDFVQSLIPDNIRETWTFERVADLIFSVISDKTESGKEILSYYNDIEYFDTDISKLTTPMKIKKFRDMGFSYLTELYQDDDSLNNLGVFLNLIKTLKGDVRGFELILQLLGLNCEISTWEDNKDLEIFTMQVLFKTSGSVSDLVRDISGDTESQGVKYFCWKNTNRYYTKNMSEPNYVLNEDIINIYGVERPLLSSSLGVVTDITPLGYPFCKLAPNYKEIQLKITTPEDNNYELFRGLNEVGVIVTSLNVIDGKLGTYTVEPNTTYGIKMIFEQSFDGYSYKYAIKSEEEMSYVELAPVEIHDLVHSVDLCRIFGGSLDLSSSYLINLNDERIPMAINLTDAQSENLPYVYNGDIIYNKADDDFEPVGVTLIVTDKPDGSSESIRASFSASGSETDRNMVKTIQKLARNYLAPLVSVDFRVVQDITVSNNYFSAGLLRGRKYKQLQISRSL